MLSKFRVHNSFRVAMHFRGETLFCSIFRRFPVGLLVLCVVPLYDLIILIVTKSSQFFEIQFNIF